MVAEPVLEHGHSTSIISVTGVVHGDGITLPGLPGHPIYIWGWRTVVRGEGNGVIWRVARGLGDGILRLWWRMVCGDGRRGLDESWGQRLMGE